jgi:LysR family cys regulon transcriptional activator
VNFQQLKIIREAARRDYNLTEVANMLYTSQSGVSRHIRELEEELGIEIFIRRGKRLLGMTEPGKALLTIAERILNEASNVRRLADLFTNDASGVLTIATTHTQARYSLPPVIKAFRELFPTCVWSLSRARRRKLKCCCKTVGRISVSPANA